MCDGYPNVMVQYRVDTLHLLKWPYENVKLKLGALEELSLLGQKTMISCIYYLVEKLDTGSVYCKE